MGTESEAVESRARAALRGVAREHMREDIKLVEAAKDDIGTLVVEQRKRQDVKDSYDIPLYYERTTEVEGQSVRLKLYFERPSELDDEAYYPCKEWRLTQEHMDECDYWPEWKAFEVADEQGRPLRHQSGQRIGMAVLAYHLIQWNVTECTEEEDGAFFPRKPVKGSDIPDLLTENRLRIGTVGATRRRVGES